MDLVRYAPFGGEVVFRGWDRAIVRDLDDAWMLRYEQIGNPLSRRALSGKFPALVRRADLVVAANSHLEDWAVRNGATAVMRVPTVVDHHRYRCADHDPQDGPVRIVWIGSPATSHYLDPLLPPL